MTTRVVLFNGPPKSGKNTACDILHHKYDAEHYSFAEPLKILTHQFFGLTSIGSDRFEQQKSTPLPEFKNMTPRMAYIYMSEQIVKPFFGKNVWAERLVASIQHDIAKNYCNGFAVVSDLGFPYELDPIVETFGGENVFIVRLYRTGCDFASDSRQYVNRPDLTRTKCVDIHNNADVLTFHNEINAFAKGVLKLK